MTLQQLEYLVALEKHGQFAAAAIACEVTQPTLSAMVKKLEEELGVTLFDRKKQPIQPTDIGSKVLEQAKRIISETKKVEALILEETKELTGEIKIGILPTIAPFLIPLLLPRWKEYSQGVKIELIECTTSRCLALLKERNLDLAIIATETDTSDLKDDLLYYEEFYGYISKNEKTFSEKVVRSSEVDRSRLWLLDEGHCFRDQLVKFCHFHEMKNRSIKYSQGHILSLMNLVEGGQGTTFIPELALRYLSPKQKEFVRPFAMPKPVREIRLAYREDYVREAIKSLITRVVKESVPASMLNKKPDQTIV